MIKRLSVLRRESEENGVHDAFNRAYESLRKVRPIVRQLNTEDLKKACNHFSDEIDRIIGS